MGGSGAQIRLTVFGGGEDAAVEAHPGQPGVVEMVAMLQVGTVEEDVFAVAEFERQISL